METALSIPQTGKIGFTPTEAHKWLARLVAKTIVEKTYHAGDGIISSSGACSQAPFKKHGKRSSTYRAFSG